MSAVHVSLGWLTDRAMHRTPQNRRCCTTRSYSNHIVKAYEIQTTKWSTSWKQTYLLVACTDSYLMDRKPFYE